MDEVTDTDHTQYMEQVTHTDAVYGGGNRHWRTIAHNMDEVTDTDAV